jgi:zinc transporter ZupT
MSDVHESLPLILSIVAVFLGPLLFSLTERVRGFGNGLRWLTISAIVLIVAVIVLPECWHEAGYWAAGSLLLGIAFPLATERVLHAAPRSLALVLPVVPLIVHAMLDGVALQAGMHHTEAHAHAGHGIIAALVLHRLPEGVAIYCLARAHGKRAAVLALVLDAVSTAAGFFLVELPPRASDPRLFALLEAFVGGILLHVLLHERPGRLEPRPS